MHHIALLRTSSKKVKDKVKVKMKPPTLTQHLQLTFHVKWILGLFNCFIYAQAKIKH